MTPDAADSGDGMAAGPVAIGYSVAGWRELVRLPDLDTRAFRAKFDTGARTSALHAEDIRESVRDGDRVVSFTIDRPRVKGDFRRTAQIADYRTITSSNGDEELRYVIETTFQVGALRYEIELTLTRRGDMRYPMLVGREALAGRILIDPSHGYLLGRPPPADHARPDEDH